MCGKWTEGKIANQSRGFRSPSHAGTSRAGHARWPPHDDRDQWNLALDRRLPLVEPDELDHIAEATHCFLDARARPSPESLAEAQAPIELALLERARRRLGARHALLDPLDVRPITHIAEQWAFTDASVFSRAFLKEFGISPKETRETGRMGLRGTGGFAGTGMVSGNSRASPSCCAGSPPSWGFPRRRSSPASA